MTTLFAVPDCLKEIIRRTGRIKPDDRADYIEKIGIGIVEIRNSAKSTDSDGFRTLNLVDEKIYIIDFFFPNLNYNILIKWIIRYEDIAHLELALKLKSIKDRMA
jgi:hypothetical protein